MVGAAVAAVGLLGAVAIKVLDTPSRPYDADANTVGNEYDAWTEVCGLGGDISELREDVLA